MKVLLVAYYLVIGGGEGKVVIPETYPSKEECVQAAKEAQADYDRSRSEDRLSSAYYSCVKAPVK